MKELVIQALGAAVVFIVVTLLVLLVAPIVGAVVAANAVGPMAPNKARV